MPDRNQTPADDALGLAGDDARMFDLAPISLWLEDYSGLKCHFEKLRSDGVQDLRAYLHGRPDLTLECSKLIRVLKVNRKTLGLFHARDLNELTSNLGRVFRDDMLDTHVEELSQLWDGQSEFASTTTNYTLSGTRLDIELKGTVLPGHEDTWRRVLIAIDDVTERETARRALEQSERYARGLFQHSPVSLWVEDFSAIRQLLQKLRDRGITDFRTFMDVHPDFIEQCMSEIRVIEVNNQTLKLFGAPDFNTLLRRLGDVFRDDMRHHFKEQLMELWNGNLFHQREVVNYTLDGTTLHLYLQLSVLPGYESTWSQVQIALTDITARKKAEAYLEYLGKHDVLSRLYNRSFYVDELNRLERKGPRPVTMIMIDLDGLKLVNDQLGHSVGDDLVARAGEVLNEAVGTQGYAARIGGDEFAVILPGYEESQGRELLQQIVDLAKLNNTFHGEPKLSFSSGLASSNGSEKLEEVMKRADDRMYEVKRHRYSLAAYDRRRDARR
jgi:diguanylate cyclase (GGDEF)-like protein